MEKDLIAICEVTAWISFWICGVWILLALSPIILPILLIKAMWYK